MESILISKLSFVSQNKAIFRYNLNINILDGFYCLYLNNGLLFMKNHILFNKIDSKNGF